MTSSIRIAIIDSGVNPSHPHVGSIAGGVGITTDGEHDDFIDRLGHGTAVAAAIHEKAPHAELCAVKIFDRVLGIDVEALVRGIDWAIARDVRLINLSLGTAKAEHEPVLRAAVGRAIKGGAFIVSAAENDGVCWLPGSLEDVIGVTLDWACPRDQYRATTTAAGRIVFRASGYPRPVPGVSPERNLKGISFAVANMTGLAARALETRPVASFADLIGMLAAGGAS